MVGDKVEERKMLLRGALGTTPELIILAFFLEYPYAGFTVQDLQDKAELKRKNVKPVLEKLHQLGMIKRGFLDKETPIYCSNRESKALRAFERFAEELRRITPHEPVPLSKS